MTNHMNFKITVDGNIAMTRYGTSHFVSKQAAIRYYRPYGYGETTKAVERKIAEGEIHIGPPSVRTGESCYLDANEGRYFVESA